jgi:hypothetical protein
MSINWSVWTYCPAGLSPACLSKSTSKCLGCGRRPTGIERVEGVGRRQADAGQVGLMALAAYSLNYPLYLMDADPFKALQKHKAVRQFAVLAKPKTVDAKAGYRRSRQGKPRIRATNRWRIRPGGT